MTTKQKGSSRTTRAWIAAVAIGLVAVASSVSEGVAGASGADAPEGSYVALGDSVPFGYSPLLEDPWVPARFVGYPEIIARQTRLTTTNLACPGQTAQAIISRTAVDNGCFDARRAAHDAGFELLHTDYSGTQIKAALEAVRSSTPPALITIQAGGNEVSPVSWRSRSGALPRRRPPQGDRELAAGRRPPQRRRALGSASSSSATTSYRVSKLRSAA